MNIIEYAKLKKMLGGVSSGGATAGGATAYHVTSYTELPSDAVDGSLALVETVSTDAVWKFNDELPNLGESFSVWEDGEGGHVSAFGITYSVYDTEYTKFSIGTHGSDSWGIYGLYYLNSDTYISNVTYVHNPSGNYGIAHGWVSGEEWKTINVSYADYEAQQWLEAHATFIGNPKKSTLYIRENGEWVKGEDINAGSGGGNTPTDEVTAGLKMTWNHLLDTKIVHVQNTWVSKEEESFLCGDLVLPDDGTVRAIMPDAFCELPYLTSVVIPDSVIYIGDSAFYDCDNLERVKIGNGVDEILTSAFNDCDNLESVELGNSVTLIDDDAFSFCRSLKNINIPDSVREIGYDVFCGCSSLESIALPASITILHSGVFSECSSLNSLTFKGAVAQWEKLMRMMAENDEDLGFADTQVTYVQCSDGTVSV